jgi:hypothetical protein
MTPLRLDIPSYDNAMPRFIGEVIRGFLVLDPLFSQIPFTSTEHVGPIRNVRGPLPLDQRMLPVRSTASLHIDTVRNSDFEDYTCHLDELAQSQIKAVASQFFKGLTEITDATGMTVNGKGKPFSYDMYVDLLDKLGVDFDDKGEPIFPTLVVPPQLLDRLKNLKPTPEQLKRRNEIIERKRAEFNAKKRFRRLS